MAPTSDPGTTDSGTGTVPPSAPPPPPPRRFVRSSTERQIGGVAGGIASYFNVDVTLVRLGFVLTTVIGGFGLLAYLALWVVAPTAPTALPAPGTPPTDRSVATWFRVGVGALLVAVGLSALVDFDLFGNWWIFGAGFPLLLVLGGGAILVRALTNRDEPTRPTPPPAGPDTRPPSGPAQDPPAAAWGAPGTEVDAAGVTDVPDGTEVPDATETFLPALPPPEPPQPVVPPIPPPPTPPPPPSGPSVTSLTLAVLFVVGGVTALGAAADWWSPSWLAVLAGGLVIVGGGVVAGVIWGRGRLLIPLGILLAIGVGFLAWFDVPLEGGSGDQRVDVTTFDELEGEYRMVGGSLRIDLTDLDFDGREIDLDASIGFGELRIDLPDDIDVFIDASVRGGEVRVDPAVGGATFESGLNADIRRVLRTDEPNGVLRLDAEVGFGQLTIDQDRLPIEAPEGLEPLPTPSIVFETEDG